MPRYPVYLQIAGDGQCMAHVLDLPGCIVRAPARDEAKRPKPEQLRLIDQLIELANSSVKMVCELF